MKTNVTMASPDRELFGVTIRQETKEGFMCVTDLQNAYEKARFVNGWSDRRVNDILSNRDTKERVYYLLTERKIINLDLESFVDMVSKEGLVTVLKGLDLWKTTGRAFNRTVMCDPYLWVLLAMELNPSLYAKVIMWLTDSLIFDRMDAGDKFKPMNSAISRIIGNPDYPKYATEINHRVFGHHRSRMRDLANSKQLKLISEIEHTVTKAIERGWVKTEEEIIGLIRTY
jgi:hypothetical protein